MNSPTIEIIVIFEFVCQIKLKNLFVLLSKNRFAVAEGENTDKKGV